ncbi:hypothetical protein [Bifidobacterium samirii]|uniref:ABC transporter ATP-binding protein n=1 Tax=Bifidobacterium samirii TaxID=2306974 RepID=A0A430FWG8_9BIFI|nr:hypothetical protein [Bifidobacterium samirii]RSX58447.1 ABC transporter ATP-binding protein [Bifidobacterium samirii]
MTFVLDEWLGEWTSFETLIDSDDPYLNRAWEESDTALRGGKSPFRYILPFFGGSARRFWGWACRTAGHEHRARIGGWRITPLPAAGDAAHASNLSVSCETSHETCEQAVGRSGCESADVTQGFTLAWLGADGELIGRHDYRLDHMIDKGLEGKPCYMFHAIDAPEKQRDPFAVLIAMDPMPSRTELADGGLLSHLHFQYASAESKLLKGEGRSARLRRRMWYPTMCAAEGDLLARCNIVRALHQLPVWTELPR